MSFSHASRRAFLARLGSVAGMAPLLPWAAGLAHAQPRPVRVRPEVSTPAGKQMLEVFRTAIGLMQDRLPMHHPHSWRFQANIHGYPSWEEPIAEIFTPGPNDRPADVRARRRLALGSATGAPTSGGVWATCPHQEADFPDPSFLPWHRLYLAYFEQIVETVAQRPFALPYWGYVDEKRRHLPEEFRSAKVNNIDNKLYYQDRNSKFLSKGLPPKLSAFLPDRKTEIFNNGNMFRNPRRMGFAEELAVDLHDQVHGAIGVKKSGLRLGMAAIELAARDPIFWLHHATIDMLWESWRRPGPNGTSARDPKAADPWYNAKYALVDAGGKRNASNGASFVLQAAHNLNYRYDELMGLPEIPIGAGPGMPEGPPTKVQEDVVADRRITGEGDSVTLALKPSVPEGVALGFSNNPTTRYGLKLTLTSAPEPGVYSVYAVKDGQEILTGSFSLFSVQAGHHAHPGAAPARVTREIDITTKIRDKSIDPLHPGEIIVRADYLDEPVDVRVNSAQLIAK
jgi:tyrosinase